MSRNLNHYWSTGFFLSAALVISTVGHAGDRPIKESPTSPALIAEMVTAAMPSILGADNTAIVDQMLNVRLAPPLSKTFDPARAIPRLLGRGARAAPDCRQVFTKTGDADVGQCVVSVGALDGGGPYRELRFAKHMGAGDVDFITRPAVPLKDVAFADLRPVTIPDDQAYLMVMDWLQMNIGLGPDEIPVAPRGAKNPFPVKTIDLAVQTLAGKIQSLPLEKAIIVQRGLFAGLGGPQGEFDWVPAPGQVLAIVDDKGVRQVSVHGWAELIDPRSLPNLKGLRAKGTQELIAEITEDLAGMGRGPISDIRILLSYAVTPVPIPNPDVSPMPIPIPAGAKLLLPAVQVFVSSVPADLTEAAQNALVDTQVSTAGSVREYPLVDLGFGG